MPVISRNSRNQRVDYSDCPAETKNRNPVEHKVGKPAGGSGVPWSTVEKRKLLAMIDEGMSAKDYAWRFPGRTFPAVTHMAVMLRSGRTKP